ncbi:hypothetical protein FACS1894104_2230 [Actinomycetota bacterium]|nr:hypothetical protein FACS1894104_2230 [Actinomycetota bacterium]
MTRTLVDITNEGYALISTVAPQIDALYMTMSTELVNDNRELYLKALHLIVEDQRKHFRPE